MNSPAPSSASPRPSQSAFTLVELLVVIGIIVVLTMLLVPAFNGIRRAEGLTAAVSTVTDLLEQARAYAMSRSTYVWVGMIEENASSDTSSATGGPNDVGRIVISVVASKHGNQIHKDSTQSNFNVPLDPAQLTQISKLIKTNNCHVAALNTGHHNDNTPARLGVATAYQVGSADFEMILDQSGAGAAISVRNGITFTYPLAATAQYTFAKIIEFRPDGTATKLTDPLTPRFEIGIQAAHGPLIDSGANRAAVQISGETGKLRVFRL